MKKNKQKDSEREDKEKVWKFRAPTGEQEREKQYFKGVVHGKGRG